MNITNIFTNTLLLESIKIEDFYTKCYIGNLQDIKDFIESIKNNTYFNINIINTPETLFYIINGLSTSRDKESIMSYLKNTNLLDLNINNGFALEISVQKNDVYLTQFLINEGVKMRPYDDGILLYYAARNNNYDMFFLLKNSGINIDAELLRDIKELNLDNYFKNIIDNIK
jgi:hypothetical protein